MNNVSTLSNLAESSVSCVSNGEQPTQGASSFVDDVRLHLAQWQEAGLNSALLTLINVEGSSPRPIGSQMLVNEIGAFVGLVSGGCVEAALVSEALNCIETNEWQLIRYGRDSDYFDIQLPCGSGIDVLIVPIVSMTPIISSADSSSNGQASKNSSKNASWVDELAQASLERKPISLSMDLVQKTSAITTRNSHSNSKSNTRKGQLTRREVEENLTHFSKDYAPRHRIVVIGQGAVFDFFLKLAESFDVEVVAYSSLYSDVESENTRSENLTCVPLKSPKSFDTSYLDEHTSMVLLSHDHDWDVPILTNALRTNVSYISALGSKATHKDRLTYLADNGVNSDDLARVKGPAGLNIGGQTPPEIALSILAEIVSKKNFVSKDNRTSG